MKKYYQKVRSAYLDDKQLNADLANMVVSWRDARLLSDIEKTGEDRHLEISKMAMQQNPQY